MSIDQIPMQLDDEEIVEWKSKRELELEDLLQIQRTQNGNLRKQKLRAHEALERIITEWDRQKNLFPDLQKDGWMDLAIAEGRSLIERAPEVKS